MERTCVRARVCAEEGVVCLFACACICLHSCDSERCPGWRSTCSSFTSAFRHQARRHGHDFQPQPLPASQLPTEWKSSRALAEILDSAPPPTLPPSPLSSDQGAGGQHFWLLARGWGSKGSQSPTEFLLTLEAEQAGVNGCLPDTVTWPGFFLIFKFPAIGSSRPFLRHLGQNMRLRTDLKTFYHHTEVHQHLYAWYHRW